MWFKEEDDVPVPCSAIEAARYQESGLGRVRLCEAREWSVCTVFLSYDAGYGSPMRRFYETAVSYRDGRPEPVARAETRPEAEQMHCRWVTLMESPLGSLIMAAAMTDNINATSPSSSETRQFDVATNVEAAAIALACRVEFPLTRVMSVRVVAEGGFQVTIAGPPADMEAFERLAPEIQQAALDKASQEGTPIA